MGYKDKDKQKEYARQHYQKNKQYYTDKRRERRAEISAFIAEYKGSRGCSLCGEKHHACLVFHHRDPSQKEVGIGNARRSLGWGIDRIMKEIEKCDILCSNCHKKLHHAMRMAIKGGEND